MFELQTLSKGDRLVLTEWETLQDIPVHHMGYTNSILKQSGMDQFIGVTDHQKTDLSQEAIEFRRIILQERDQDDLIAACARHVMDISVHKELVRPIPPDEEWQYRLSNALYDLYTELVKAQNGVCEGVIYPSAQTWPNGDNLALSPTCVDTKLAFRRAYEFQIIATRNDRITARITDIATQLGPDKSLFWTSAGRSFKAA